MEVRKRGLVLALVLSCFLAQVFSAPGTCINVNPRVGCPAGHDNNYGYSSASISTWGSLCPYYQTCSTGKSQSPINLDNVSLLGRTSTKLNLTLGTEQIRLTRGRDWLVMPVTGTHTLRWMEQNWGLQRLEFHSPSEHTINGRYFDLEIQLYFKYTDRRGTFTAALAVLYRVGGTCDDAFLSKLIPAIPCRYKCECGNNRTENFGPWTEQCDQGADNANVANRCRTNCTLPRCGDGILDSFYEQCDNGASNGNAPGACRSNCKLPYCGDNIVDPGETCDDGNLFEGDGCTANCTLECGDCCLQPNEQCDLCAINHSNRTNATYSVCRTNCLFARCGDGIVDVGEQCDAGAFANRNSTGGSFAPNICRPNCTLPRCGDGVVDNLFGETCEPPNSQFCSSNCTLLCGNGVTETSALEACDNGTANSNASDAVCRLNCQLRRCGDGVVDPAFGEQCDTVVETDACFANCTFKCGNRQIEGNEVCDNGHPSLRPLDGNSNTRPNACRLNCRPYFCGDGVVDPRGCEQCDNTTAGNANLPNRCRTNCTLPVCGDGILDAGEECDDGNNIDDDGCSCCKLDCGNGILQGNERCDDGAANSATLPDRCRPVSCRPHFCGDGVTDADEECDSRTRGCTANCTLPFCGDGLVQTWLGEECDNGADNNYAALDSDSRLACSPLCTINRCGQTFPNPTQTVDLSTLFGGNGVVGSIAYVGSETRPPCSEGVQWFVATTVRTLTRTQARAFSRLLLNSRPVQGTYARNPAYWPTRTVGTTPIDYRAAVTRMCGNGIVELGEECDNGRMNHATLADRCRPVTCRAPRCGDGVVDSGEECDGQAYCTSTCRMDRRQYIVRPAVGACWTTGNQGLWAGCSNNTCASGMRQSPIRLPETCPSNRPLNLNHPSNVQYNPAPIILFNTGSALLFPITTGGAFSYRGVTYTLRWIEFHEPSEHYIGNKQFPFEVQLFHQSQNAGVDQWAVLSVLFDVGQTPNSFLQPLLDRLPPVSECMCGNGIKEDVMILADGKIAREECDAGALNNDHIPNRCRTNCRMAYCGDNVVDSCESCDQGPMNANSPNVCRPNCVLPFCGDGIVDDLMGEQCDDNNNRNNDGCNSQCQLECGDGVVQGAEQCDMGSWNSNTKSDGCRTDCKTARCGDGVVDYALGEQCDDGTRNANTSNSCRANCRLPFCGDGVVDQGESCDSTPGCSATCTPLCGNGVRDNTTNYAEECDTGSCNSNTVPNSCRLNCRAARCGDGVRDNGEECDTGANTPQCVNCQVRCGNGIIDDGEECDDGILNSNTVPNACRTNCQLYSCGDGIADRYEECDNGTANGATADRCRPWCRIPKCGDGIVDSGETCDDGNELDGDGCSCVCQRECGNGRVDPGEVCDDGPRNSNTRPGCCRANCVLPRCGDGVTDAGEECDDGASARYAPNGCRPDCTLPRCGDGIVDNLYGETCDQGSRNSLTVVDGCSPKCTLNWCRQSVHLNTTVNPADVLPTTPGVYHYQGSRNSPPCAENYEWFVFTSPQPISACQLGQFRRALTGNTRCLQPRNGRPVNYLELNARCGDGMVEGNEQCDNGPQNSDFAPNACRRNCRMPRCGDGVQDKGEQCDGTPNCTPQCTLACAAAAGASANATATSTDSVINVNFANILSP